MRKHEIKNILVQYFVGEAIFNENALSLIVDVQSVSSSKKLEIKFQISTIRNSGKRERKRMGREREGEREREREREREEREREERERERRRENFN